MRALAEFVMRGRVQAGMVALLCTFVPLISPAVVALVTLRRGLVDGAFIALWAFLPPVVYTVANPELLPYTFMELSALAGLIGGALLLRAGSHWSVALLGLISIGATGGFVFAGTFPDFVQELVTTFNQAQQEAVQATAQPGQEKALEIVEFSAVMIAGFVAVGISLNAFFALVLGRWWQSLLYNPGGFQQEFHQLRLSKTQTLICFGVTAICISQPNLSSWGLLAGLPLLMVATAVVHNAVTAKGMGVQWLILFYLLAFWPMIMWLTMLIGFVDAWLDFRSRFGTPPPPAQQSDEE